MFKEFAASALSKQYNMFKEIVFSAAIISSFFLNMAFVDHPNASSYTLCFVISLLAIAVLLLLWNHITSGNSFGTCLRELGETIGILRVSVKIAARLMDGVTIVEGPELISRSLA